MEVFGLTSKDGKAFNGRVGVHRGEVKPGRVAVLLVRARGHPTLRLIPAQVQH